ncbi:MAG: hypothetical protein ACHQ7M_19195 [Chloroflexota bacterium]
MADFDDLGGHVSQWAREHPDEDYDEHVRQVALAASRCPHGETHWKDCEACVEDERGVRVYERSLDK